MNKVLRAYLSNCGSPRKVQIRRILCNDYSHCTEDGRLSPSESFRPVTVKLVLSSLFDLCLVVDLTSKKTLSRHPLSRHGGAAACSAFSWKTAPQESVLTPFFSRRYTHQTVCNCLRLILNSPRRMQAAGRTSRPTMPPPPRTLILRFLQLKREKSKKTCASFAFYFLQGSGIDPAFL